MDAGTDAGAPPAFGRGPVLAWRHDVLEAFCRFILRHRARTLIATGALIGVAVAALVIGGRLTSGSFRGLESDAAQSLVEEVTGHADDVTFVAIFRRAGAAADDAAAAAPTALTAAMERVLAPLRQDARVAAVVTAADAPSVLAPRMTSAAGDTQVAFITLRGDFAEALASYPGVRARMSDPEVEIIATGQVPFMHDMNATMESDLVRAELIALPLALLNRVIVSVRFPGDPLTDERVSALVDLTTRLQATSDVHSVDSLFTANPLADKTSLGAFLRDPPTAYAPIVEQAKALSAGPQVAIVYVLTDTTADSEAGRELVRAIRRERGVGDGTLLVGGDAAKDVDATDFLVSRAPFAILFVVGVTLVLLFLVLRSVLLPIKAVVMNFLSMTGSFGALVWIFQDGHFGIREPRPLEPTLPVLLFCVLFGLSMDYEVLLLSRMREAYQRSGDNTEAVAEGLERTAGLITSAAAIMVTVFGAFAFARVVMVQAVGVGMALAVMLDATLVRTLLVPATMRLLGHLNWWAPRWMQRKADRGARAPPAAVVAPPFIGPVRDASAGRRGPDTPVMT